jgi:putative tryptophan/tyrosine transport system substrate-binding protein
VAACGARAAVSKAANHRIVEHGLGFSLAPMDYRVRPATARVLRILNTSSENDFDSVFARLAELQAGGLVIATDGLFISRSEHLAALTVRHAKPAIFQFRAFAAAGGLMSYGGSLVDLYRLSGIYTGRILKGEKPADLPVQQSAKVELIINMKTAKALGLTVPLPLLARADEVIE